MFTAISLVQVLIYISGSYSNCLTGAHSQTSWHWSTLVLQGSEDHGGDSLIICFKCKKWLIIPLLLWVPLWMTREKNHPGSIPSRPQCQSLGPGELRRLRSFVAFKTTGLKLFLLMICYHGGDTGHEMGNVLQPQPTKDTKWFLGAIMKAECLANSCLTFLTCQFGA